MMPPPTTKSTSWTTGHQAAFGPFILAYLSARDRFRIATLLRLEHCQANALYAIPSASLANASRRGLVDLLDFRLSSAKTPIPTSIEHVESLFWTLKSSESSSSPSLALSSNRCGQRLQPVRIEWWEFKNYADQVDSALRAAALHNDVDVLGWWTAHANAFSSHVEVSVAKIAAAALAAGNVGLLQWCRDTHGWNPRNIDPAVLRLAAASDRADALRWLETELAPGSDDDNADRDDDVLRQVSALNFSDDALQLAQLRRRPANSLDLRKVAQHAAANGQVAVLDWIKATAAAGRGEFAPENVVRVATAAGHVAVLHWWRLNYPHDSWKPDSGCMEQACEGGHVEVLQFWRATAEAQKLEFYPSMLWYAAREGRVAVFRWWSERFPAPDSRASETLVQEAVLGEHLELLDWFRSSGFVRDMVCDISVAVRSPKAFALCARNRLRLKKRTENLRGLIERHALNLDIIRWLRERRDDGGGRNGDDDDDDTWSSVPSDQDWPRMSLLQLAAGFSSDKSPYYVWYDSDLDALEWWWRERGAQVSSETTTTTTTTRPLSRLLVELCVPFLEWLAVRNLGIPVFGVQNAPSEGCGKEAKVWWKEARRRFPPEAFISVGGGARV